MKQRIDDLIELGKLLADQRQWVGLMNEAFNQNSWFTEQNVRKALNTWAGLLTRKNLEDWTSSYSISSTSKKVGMIMAGNIPLVGMHDFVCGVLSSHQLRIKLSSDDEVLMKAVINGLIAINPDYKKRIEISSQMKGIDALIATGSNNSARHFEYYFRSIPKVIRKSRASLAVVEEHDSAIYKALGDDIFAFFGKGCMNVTQLLLHRSIDIVKVIDGLEQHEEVMNNHRYHNNYLYHKAIYLMNKTEHLDNGFVLFKEDLKLHSPLGVIYYHFYDDLSEVQEYIKGNQGDIQLVATESNLGLPDVSTVKPGDTQCNKLHHYADNVDVIAFLNAL